MTANVPNYPGVQSAHEAIHIALDDNATGLHDRLVVGACHHRRQHTQVCRVDFRGEVPLRLRVTVRKAAFGLYIVKGRITKDIGE